MQYYACIFFIIEKIIYVRQNKYFGSTYFCIIKIFKIALSQFAWLGDFSILLLTHPCAIYEWRSEGFSTLKIQSKAFSKLSLIHYEKTISVSVLNILRRDEEICLLLLKKYSIQSKQIINSDLGKSNNLLIKFVIKNTKFLFDFFLLEKWNLKIVYMLIYLILSTVHTRMNIRKATIESNKPFIFWLTILKKIYHLSKKNI